MTKLAALAALGLLLAPCSRPPAYEASTLVLEEGNSGPELCLGAVNNSYPPRCGGPPAIGWDWDDVEDEESASGTTWGEYHVVGTWDGASLTLTEKPGPARDPGPSDETFATPCPAPTGGWAVIDEQHTTEDAMNAAVDYARQQPEFAGVWLDQSINPADGAADPVVAEERMNNPKFLVLNIRFTDDLAAHESGLREIWGGSLCVSEARHTSAELETIATELRGRLDDAVTSSIDEVAGTVEFTRIAPDPDLQESLDEEYGAGVVKISSILQPVNP